MPESKRRQPKLIGEWTEEELDKRIGTKLQTSLAELPLSFSGDEITASSRLIVLDQIQLSPQALQYIKDNLPP